MYIDMYMYMYMHMYIIMCIYVYVCTYMYTYTYIHKVYRYTLLFAGDVGPLAVQVSSEYWRHVGNPGSQPSKL